MRTKLTCVVVENDIHAALQFEESDGEMLGMQKGFREMGCGWDEDHCAHHFYDYNIPDAWGLDR